MTIIEAAAAIAVCAVILIAVLMLKKEVIMPLRPGKDLSLIFLIRASEEAKNLEQTANGLLWMCRSANAQANIFICDAGMTKEAKKAAEILTRKDKEIKLCLPEQIDVLIEEIVCKKNNT